MFGGSCDMVSALLDCSGYATQLACGKDLLRPSARRHRAHSLPVLTLARNTSRSRPCPSVDLYNGQT
jgi:hypothetical protein